MKLLTHNWGLKLLALTLAIVIYQSLKTKDTALRHDIRHDRTQQQRP